MTVCPELDIEQLVPRICELVCRSDLDQHEHHSNPYDEIYAPTSLQLQILKAGITGDILVWDIRLVLAAVA